ncbi:hypothetical protein C5Y93_22860 [Blastopirellula marina]|uniref:Uncharacterized protein n=1 Tax=Blastopirellula marina TaxID=124 RepID=A0A2S8GGB4_9BACT|nr:hypothetical protein C5Y93_22860 [Blastopirellula marina]
MRYIPHAITILVHCANHVIRRFDDPSIGSTITNTKKTISPKPPRTLLFNKAVFIRKWLPSINAYWRLRKTGQIRTTKLFPIVNPGMLEKDLFFTLQSWRGCTLFRKNPGEFVNTKFFNSVVRMNDNLNPINSNNYRPRELSSAAVKRYRQ